MAQARSESIPMLGISSTLARRDLGHGALHELPDQRRLLESVALWSDTLLDPAGLPGSLDRAFAATSGRTGPVHLEIPLDVLALPCDPVSPPRVLLAPSRRPSAASPLPAAR